MSGQKRNNMPLTQQGVITEEAMLAYLKGELSPELTAQFEQLLADDPFAHEAMEGLQAANPNTLKTTFAAISQQVEEKTGATKQAATVSFYGIARYAAAAVLIVGLIGFAFLITNYFNKQANQVALSKEESLPQATDATPLFNETQEPAVVPDIIAPAQDSLAVAAPVVENIQEEADMAAETSETSMAAKAVQSKQIAIAAPTAPPAISTVSGTEAKKADARMQAAKLAEKTAKETSAKAKQTPIVPAKPVVAADASKQESQAVVSPIQNSASGASAEKLPDNTDDDMESFNSRDYKAAAKKFNKIVDKDPSNLDAIYFEGISQFINGDNNKALKSFDKLLVKGAKHADGSKWYKAQILLKKGKKEEATKLLHELQSGNSSFKDRAVNKLEEIEK